MGWYLYPLGLSLAVAGGMALLLRARRTQAFFLLAALTYSLFFFYKVRVWHDHYFAMRRFIPVILPAFFVAMAFLLSSLRESGGRLAAPGSRVVAVLLVGVYLVSGHRLWRHNEFRGSLAFVEELARHIGDDDVAIFPAQEGLHLLELPLAQLEDRKVLEFYTLKPESRSPGEAPRELEGSLSRRVLRDQLQDFALGTLHPPRQGLRAHDGEVRVFLRSAPEGTGAFNFRFTLSKAVDLEDLARRVPKLPTLDVGGSDDLQVAWFHEKELEADGTSFRWSQRTSSVFLPAVGAGSRTIALRLAGPKEAEAPLNPVEAALDGSRSGRFPRRARSRSTSFRYRRSSERGRTRRYCDPDVVDEDLAALERHSGRERRARPRIPTRFGRGAIDDVRHSSAGCSPGGLRGCTVEQSDRKQSYLGLAKRPSSQPIRHDELEAAILFPRRSGVDSGSLRTIDRGVRRSRAAHSSPRSSEESRRCDCGRLILVSYPDPVHPILREMVSLRASQRVCSRFSRAADGRKRGAQRERADCTRFSIRCPGEHRRRSRRRFSIGSRRRRGSHLFQDVAGGSRDSGTDDRVDRLARPLRRLLAHPPSAASRRGLRIRYRAERRGHAERDRARPVPDARVPARWIRRVRSRSRSGERACRTSRGPGS